MSSVVKLRSSRRLLARAIVEQVEVDVAGAGGRDPGGFLVLKAGIRILNYFGNQLVVCIADFRLPCNLCEIKDLIVRGEA